MYTEANVPEIEQHLFTEEDIFKYEEASKGQRALNLIIDNLLMSYGLSYLTGSLIGYILANFFPSLAYELFYEPENSLTLLMLDYTIGMFNYIIYYTICEKAFRGYTLGKLITGTRAVKENGQELSFKDAFLRSCSRLVPFEALSALWGAPWHDSWTKTMVIKSR